MSRARSGVAAAGLGAVMAFPASLAAQQRDLWEVALTGAWAVPLASLVEDGELEVGLASAPAVAARVGARASPRVSVGVSAVYLPGDLAGRFPVGEGRTDHTAWLAGTDVMYRPGATGGGRASPFLAAGAGLKHYRPADGEPDTDFAWSAGGGIDLPLARRLSLRLEARNHMSIFSPEFTNHPSRIQHDMVAAVGLAVTIPRVPDIVRKAIR